MDLQNQWDYAMGLFYIRGMMGMWKWKIHHIDDFPLKLHFHFVNMCIIIH